jgi:hypothetical protein
MALPAFTFAGVTTLALAGATELSDSHRLVELGDRSEHRRPMAGTNDVLNNVRDFDSLRAAMPHSPGPHKYSRTRIPPARPYLSGHVVVAHMQNLFCTNWFIPRFDRGLLVQNHVQQGIMHFQCSIVFDETQFAEFIHEEAHPRSGRADHLGKHFLAVLSDNPLRPTVLAEICKKKEKACEALFARIEQLIN